jgi:hypothetical protein
VKAVHSKNGPPPGSGSGQNVNPKSGKKGKKGKGKKTQLNQKKANKNKGGKVGWKSHQADVAQQTSNRVGKSIQTEKWVEPTTRPWRVWSGSQRSQYSWNPRTHLQKWGNQHQSRNW